MQIFGMIIFIVVWLLILWIGSIALEATGMDRSRARFQALSALSGTGFTTRQAEAIVENPRRRRIVSYLIFLGNVGIVALILLVVLFARAGIDAPSPATIIISIVVLLAVGFSIWFRLVDKLTSAILKLVEKENAVTRHITRKILYQAGDYAMVRLAIRNKEAHISGLSIEEVGFKQQDIAVLVIERDKDIISQPQPEEKLMPGDYLLCYGELASINVVIKRG